MKPGLRLGMHWRMSRHATPFGAWLASKIPTLIKFYSGDYAIVFVSVRVDPLYYPDNRGRHVWVRRMIQLRLPKVAALGA